MAPAWKIRGLECDEPLRSAAGKIVWTRFEEMLSHRERALNWSDPEGVHDMRVSSRRLRAALELFSTVFPQHAYRAHLRDVKRLADALGGVRDLDVMIERMDKDMAGRPPAQRTALARLRTDMEGDLKRARKSLERTIDDLEREDFPRRFMTFLARATD